MPVAVVLITPEPPAHTVKPTGCVVILVFGFTVTVTPLIVVGLTRLPNPSIVVE